MKLLSTPFLLFSFVVGLVSPGQADSIWGQRLLEYDFNSSLSASYVIPNSYLATPQTHYRLGWFADNVSYPVSHASVDGVLQIKTGPDKTADEAMAGSAMLVFSVDLWRDVDEAWIDTFATDLNLRMSGQAGGGWICEIERQSMSPEVVGEGEFSGSGFDDFSIDLGGVEDLDRDQLSDYGFPGSCFTVRFYFYGPDANALVRIDNAEFVGGYDRTRPGVTLRSARTTRQSTYTILGNVFDDTLVYNPQIIVNGNYLNLPYYARLGKSLPFSHRVRLKRGLNRIEFDLEDACMNYALERFYVRLR